MQPIIKRYFVLIAVHCLIIAATAQNPSCGNGKLVCVKSTDGVVSLEVQRKDDTTFTFRLSGKVAAGSYIAVGFSKDQTMGQDAVVACFPSSVKTFVNPQGHTPAKEMQWSSGSPMSSAAAFSGDRLTCSFDIPSKIDAGSGISFDLTESTYVLLARGPGPNMQIQQHAVTPTSLQLSLGALKPSTVWPVTTPGSADSGDSHSSTPAPSKASFGGSDVKYLAFISFVTVLGLTI